MLSPRYYFAHYLFRNLGLIRMDCLCFIKILFSRNIYSRNNHHGHITASGLVIKNDKVLLIRHPFIGKYFQPGGHIDENETPLEAAIREVYEETGWKCSPHLTHQQILDIDIHLIPENKKKLEAAHWHIDLCYQLNPIEQTPASESLSATWLEISRVESQRVRRAFKKAMRLDQAANTSNNSVSS